jgi:hypothetical protein
MEQLEEALHGDPNHALAVKLEVHAIRRLIPTYLYMSNAVLLVLLERRGEEGSVAQTTHSQD